MANLRNLITERDNQTLCPVRMTGIVFGFVGSATFIALAIYNVVVGHQAFDYVAFAGGLSGIWATFAAAVGLKQRFAESKPDQGQYQG